MSRLHNALQTPESNTVSVDLQEPAYKNPRLVLWSASKKGLGWLGLTLARASKNIQASFSWRKNRGLDAPTRVRKAFNTLTIAPGR